MFSPGPAALNRDEQYERWNNFKEEALLPLVAEMGILNAKDAQSWRGSFDYTLPHTNRVIHIHNPRSCGFRPIPLYSYISAPSYTNVTNNNITNNYYNGAAPAQETNTNRNNRKNAPQEVEDEKKNDKLSTTAIVVIVAACVVGILYTGYQMAHSIGQSLSSSRKISKMDKAMKALDEVSGLDRRQRRQIEELVEFREEYLSTALSRSRWDVAEDVAVIGGLALVAVGAILSMGAPIAILGGATVIAAIITKFVTHKIWPNLEDDSELKEKSQKKAALAQALLNQDLRVPVSLFSEPTPPAEPHPLYPNLNDDPQFKVYMQNVFYAPAANFNFAPSAPPLGT